MRSGQWTLHAQMIHHSTIVCLHVITKERLLIHFDIQDSGEELVKVDSVLNPVVGGLATLQGAVDDVCEQAKARNSPTRRIGGGWRPSATHDIVTRRFRVLGCHPEPHAGDVRQGRISGQRIWILEELGGIAKESHTGLAIVVIPAQLNRTPAVVCLSWNACAVVTELTAWIACGTVACARA